MRIHTHALARLQSRRSRYIQCDACSREIDLDTHFIKHALGFTSCCCCCCCRRCYCFGWKWGIDVCSLLHLCFRTAECRNVSVISKLDTAIQLYFIYTIVIILYSYDASACARRFQSSCKINAVAAAALYLMALKMDR